MFTCVCLLVLAATNGHIHPIMFNDIATTFFLGIFQPNCWNDSHLYTCHWPKKMSGLVDGLYLQMPPHTNQGKCKDTTPIQLLSVVVATLPKTYIWPHDFYNRQWLPLLVVWDNGPWLSNTNNGKSKNHWAAFSGVQVFALAPLWSCQDIATLYTRLLIWLF